MELMPLATISGLRLALAPIAGSLPALVNHGDYYSLVFTPEQEANLSAWIVRQINHDPGPIRIESGGIVRRVIAKQYWPHILGIAAVGGALGYFLRGRKR
jgi:hypothetical protein